MFPGAQRSRKDLESHWQEASMEEKFPSVLAMEKSVWQGLL